ncbi:hypothetical protein ACS0TY_008427 [Phlomoides rotata]
MATGACRRPSMTVSRVIRFVSVSIHLPIHPTPANIVVPRSDSQMHSAMNILLRRTIVSLRRRRFSVLDRVPEQIKNLSDLVDVTDEDCRDQLRMDRVTFHKLCFMLQSVAGLKSSRRVTVTEKVVMFLSVLAHHTKNRCVKFHFKRSGQTLSKHFHMVLHCVLRMHSLFLVKPQAVNEDSTDVRWQKFPIIINIIEPNRSCFQNVDRCRCTYSVSESEVVNPLRRGNCGI